MAEMRVRHYFDHAASSPLSPVCLQEMARYDAQPWAGANPNSLHTSGRAAFSALERARADVAHALGAKRPSEIVFTSGGTEANTLAIKGTALALLQNPTSRRRRVLVSAVEHDSVFDPSYALERDGFSIERIPVLSNGVVDLNALERMLGPDTALVCVMGANNEVGCVQPLAEVVSLAHACGALVHCDAIQTFGHIPFDVAQLGVDTASVAAHKLGGPVSCGALYVRSRTPIAALQVGGGQEAGLRSGTQDVRNAMAFAAVAKQAVTGLASNDAYLRGLGRAIVDELASQGCDFVETLRRDGVEPPETLPNIVHLLVPGHQTEGLVLGLDDLGYEVSGGSACSSGSLEPSHVLNAMGVPRDLAFCALRISFDARTTLDDCRGLAQALAHICRDSSKRRR